MMSMSEGLSLVWYVAQCAVMYRVSVAVFAALRAIVCYRILPIFYKPDLRSKYSHRWCVVTGCTDGIGKAYTRQLLQNGITKFILIGRNEHKLDVLEHQLRMECKNNERLKCQRLVFDFDHDDHSKITNYLKNIDVGFCVHSAGLGPSRMAPFCDELPRNRSIMRVNCWGTFELLGAVVPRMAANGGGQVVLISSSMGLHPAKSLLVYSASKCMTTYFGRGIADEYSKAGIKIQTLAPGLVATNMTRYDTGGLFVMMPDQFVKQAISTIGVLDFTSGCLSHELQYSIEHLFPWFILKHIMNIIFALEKVRFHKAGQDTTKWMEPEVNNNQIHNTK